MKRIAAFLLAFLMMGCAVFGASGLAATTAMAEPAESAQTAEVQQEKTEAPSAEPTPAAQEPQAQTGGGETPAATDAPEDANPPVGDASAETPAPVENETTDPDAGNKGAKTAEPVVEGEGPAWIAIENGRLYGELVDIIPLADDTIYIESKEVLELPGYTVDALKPIKFAPDPELFTKKTDVVIVSDLNPDGEAKENVVFIWVGEAAGVPEKQKTALDNVPIADVEYTEIEIRVRRMDGENGYPTFTLMSVPELSQTQRFAVAHDGGAPIALPGDTYVPEAPGELRFAVLDEKDNVLAKSVKYIVEELQSQDENGGTAAGDDGTDSGSGAADDPSNAAVEPTLAPDGAQTDDNSPTVAPDTTDVAADEPANTAGNGTPETINNVTASPDDTASPDETMSPDDAASNDEPPLSEDGDGAPEPQAVGLEVRTVSQQEAVDIEIYVDAIDYFPGETSDVEPTFTLSGLPDAEGYWYGVMIDDDGQFEPISNTYTAKREGSYTLRFAILDGGGNIADKSVPYNISLDFSTPSVTKKQAWMYNDNSQKIYGTLSGLLSQASSGSTIYLLTNTDEIISLGGGAGRLAGITLKPDPDKFSAAHSVRTSVTHPVSGESGLYVWIVDLSGLAGGGDKAELRVTPDENYRPGQWSNNNDYPVPVFALSIVPDTASGYRYAVMIDDGTPIELSGNCYTADDEGKYTFRFVLLDELDRIAARSAVYTVWLDATPPVMRVEAGQDGSLTVTATDNLSETLLISIDGGATWHEAVQLESGALGYKQIFTASTIIAADMIQVKDAAGNIAKYDQPTEIVGMGGMGGFGGFGGFGGGGGGDSRTISHSSADSSDTTAYNAVELSTEEEEMTVLTLGGETLDLSIARASTDGEPIDGEAVFMASLCAWNGEEDDAYDTLVLTANTDGESDEYAFLWDFSGTVYKKLAASGIDYLVLRVDDRVTAISTAGFTAGTRYNLLKSSGVSSKEFHYSVLMGVPAPELDMAVEVENATYALTDDDSNEMYYYDVYTGGADMMNAAFGAH